MFAIYGTSGLMYRGPVEDLRKVVPTLQIPGIRPLQVALDRLTPLAEPLAPEPRPEPAPHPTTQALQAYADTQKHTTAHHPLRVVGDVMSPEPVVVAPDASRGPAWGRLTGAGIGQVPVVDAAGGLVGLLTRAELLARTVPPAGGAPAATAWRAWQGTPVAQAMVSPVPGVSAEVDLRRLALILLETGLPGLPVVGEAGRVEGFVTRSDILKAVVHDPPLDLWAG